MIFYMFLISSIGYLIGSLIQISRTFIILLPAVAIGIALILKIYFASNAFFKIIADFYFSESSILLFSIKALITSIVLFSGAMLISNSLEVRK